VNKQAFFARQLAHWLLEVDWHYNTLLAATIECTSELPDDCDSLVNELLLRYPAKPSRTSITEYLLSSERLANWFGHNLAAPSSKPTITRFALQQPSSATHAGTPLPEINTIGDLAKWLSLTVTELDWFANFWRTDASTPEHRKHYQYELLARRLFDRAQQELLKQRHLPQGVPTSPALANAVLNRLDRRLSGLAGALEMDYSRYADDIAMSSQSIRDWRFLEPLIGGICIDERVSLNYKKTRIKRSHQKQRLVGIVVNSKPNIDRHYFDALKATLTNCKRHGLESQNREGHPHFRAHLLGRKQYVKSLKQQRGVKLDHIYHEIKAH